MDIFSPTILDDALITGSNTANLLQVSSPTNQNILFVSGSGRVGIGTATPLYQLHISGSGVVYTSNRFIGAGGTAADPTFTTISTIAGIFEPSYANLGFSSFGGEAGRIEGASRLWNIGMTGGTAKLNVRGTGATSATTAIRVENSNASASLVVTDDIRVGINKTSPNSTLDVNGNTTITGSITSTSNITTLGTIATPTQTISGVNGWAPSSGTTNLLNIAGNLLPTSTAIINSLAITSTVSQSVNPTTIIRGILVSPTFNTLGSQYRGFEWNNNQGFGLYGVGAAPNYLSGSLGIGTTTPSASLHVQGNLQISTGSLYTYGQNTDIDSGSIRTVMSVATGSYRAAFFDYVLNKSTNARAGTVFSVWNGTSVEWNDVSTNDIGNTTEVNLSVGLSGANVVLYASSSTNDWSMKALARML